MGWYRRFANLLRSNRVSVDIDREMAFHMNELADDLTHDAPPARTAVRGCLGATLVARRAAPLTGNGRSTALVVTCSGGTAGRPASLASPHSPADTADDGPQRG